MDCKTNKTIIIKQITLSFPSQNLLQRDMWLHAVQNNGLVVVAYCVLEQTWIDQILSCSESNSFV